MTTIFSNLKSLDRAACIVLAAAGALTTLSACAQTQEALPTDPGAIVAAQNEALSRPTGSGFVFKAQGSFTGPGGLAVDRANDAALPLSLDDAMSIGLARNVRLKYDRANMRAVKGDTLGVLNALIPNLSVNAESSAQQLNLAALGFKPSLFASLPPGLLPPGYVFNEIVKVQTTQASVNASQVLFNLPDYELYRGTTNETRVVDLQRLTDDGDLVLTIGTSYLQVLADQANVANTEAQQRSANTLFDQATQKHQAGVGTNLDALRGQVEYQQREQDVVAAQSQLEKDTIQLTRILGLPAGQKLELTDAAPFAELAAMDLDAAKITAYKHRKDYLSVLEQIALTQRELKAVKYQRLPTLAFNGFYGVIGLTTSDSYHGIFTAEGSLSVPIFREAAQRGEQDVVDAQLTALHQREADLRVTIDAQIRTSMLDVNAAKELVRVAQSNVELAQQELADERDRFAAGVDDNLPLVDAQGSVASAQAQLVNSLYQYNVAKLQLARNTGVVETRYRAYLGKP
ncbi:TolC family protein [Granulicella sp. L46]|uniref:TolC family protein n=1 Tax=Granulicella sp. L46 TaxID=1641865 RepID=UPI00131BA126|nr:TolC family protein [Granulicella sp. L46]